MALLGLPDRCDSNAKTLMANASVLGQALRYNAPAAEPTPAQPAQTPGETLATPPK